MSKIRINELARELEVKPHAIIEVLPELGISEKKTHSSSLEDDQALLVRRRLGGEAAVEEAARRGPSEFEPDEHEYSPPEHRAIREPELVQPMAPVIAAAQAPAEVAKEVLETPVPPRPMVPVRPPLATGGAHPGSHPSPHPAPHAPSHPIAPPQAAPAPRGIPIPSRPGPPTPKPGQILTGPRQPLPSLSGLTPRIPSPPTTFSPDAFVREDL